MAASYNRVILAGNLTRDPQLSYTPSNTPVCQFGLAVNRKWRDREGNLKEEVCFVDLNAFGKQAETINQYMSKGSGILVEGRLKLEQWTSKEGQNRSKLSVVVENFSFTGGGTGGSRGSGGARAASGGGQERARQDVVDDGYDDAPPPPSDDDIPF